VKPPIRIAIVGLGGFAGSHHNAVARLEERGHAKLICTCDPRADSFMNEREVLRLTERGVSVFPDYRAMLAACARDLDLVVVPTPINLHAEMHAAVTALGLPVYLEKPPTLNHAELERMIESDRQSPKASLVGFNFIIEHQRLALKQRILAGDFGAVRCTTLNALWPRPASYFERNNWAGRLMMDDRPVLDSCLGNAMAHFVHNMLFWAGTTELYSWAQLASVRAELYRAHAIEGADTFFVEADTTASVNMRFALSHACAGAATHNEVVICENATLHYAVGRHIEIHWRDGRVERSTPEPFDGLECNHLDYYRYLRGESTRPATSLVDSRPFVAINDLAHISSGLIAPIPSALVTGVREEKEQKDYINVAGMNTALDAFLANGTWPSSNGWGHPGGTVTTPADLPRFEATVRAMAGK
jgi:predicted dehydrogenase